MAEPGKVCKKGQVWEVKIGLLFHKIIIKADCWLWILCWVKGYKKKSPFKRFKFFIVNHICLSLEIYWIFRPFCFNHISAIVLFFLKSFLSLLFFPSSFFQAVRSTSCSGYDRRMTGEMPVLIRDLIAL